MLNTRPLVYVEPEDQEQRVLRPIDFLQSQFEVAPPLVGESNEDDPDYDTPAEQSAPLTKRQLIEAIESSTRIIQQFW